MSRIFNRGLRGFKRIAPFHLNEKIRIISLNDSHDTLRSARLHHFLPAKHAKTPAANAKTLSNRIAKRDKIFFELFRVFRGPSPAIKSFL